MKIISSLTSALLLSALSFITGEVVELTDLNFEHQTQAATGQTTGKWFVDFYAPWCGHCKNLEPIWDELAAKVAEENASDGIIIAKVDVTVEKDVAQRFSISSLPTLRYFADRTMYVYEGERTLEAFHAFVTGGYMDGARTETITQPPGWMDIKLKELESLAMGNEFLAELLEDFREIVGYRKNAAAVLVGMGFAIGVLIGMALGMSMVSSSKEKKTQSKRKKA